ncbi:unnamed protein product [Polarella glacialis]|uniref:Uncharacterized protein n=1 Tax=Polarella glacialis TaxID=89957 RepID=A0A813JVF2_POLGL|nr:unnamed protein product [Polarella glacialis]CAE8685197.1 unnamed protein product [Polarella glacialis]
MLFVVGEVKGMNRIWRMHSLQSAVRFGHPVYLACATCVLAATVPFPGGNSVFGTIDSAMAESLMKTRVGEAGAVLQEDKRAILEWFAQGDGVSRFEHRLQHWAAGPILRAAAAADDDAKISAICRVPGLWLGCPSLRGGLGETALHVAAANGASKALRCLLAAGMDPNAGDGFQERPLHYAALAGMVDAAALLLAALADPLCESQFGETALEVAQQSPAGFLGVDTAEVVALLSRVAVQGCDGGDLPTTCSCVVL